MQPLAVGEKTYHARIRRTALSIYRQQSRILYNSTMEIGKFTKNESTNDSDNQQRRAEASRQRPARKKGNRQQRGCSLSRKWSHNRSRCKCRTHVAISVALPDNERRSQAKSAAMCRSSIERSAPTSETSKRRAREKPGSGVSPSMYL